METISTFSATRPPPPPPSPPHIPRQFSELPPPPQTPEPQHMIMEEPQHPYMYYEPPPPQEQKTSFFMGLTKKILFLIFLAFVAGLFVGKSMTSTVIIQR